MRAQIRAVALPALTPTVTRVLTPALTSVLALVLALALAGCACEKGGGGSGGGGPGAGHGGAAAKRERAAVQGALDRQAAAVRDGREKRFLAQVDPRARRCRAAQRLVFRNLRRLPLRSWSYRVTRVRAGQPSANEPSGNEPRAEATVRLRYRLSGQDRAPVTATERYAFVRRGGRWYLTGELSGSERQLWEQGPMTVVRGRRSLVLGTAGGEHGDHGEHGDRSRSGDAERRRLRDVARVADRAAAEAGRLWPHGWPRRVVVERPRGLRQMARLLGSPESAYRDIAAVTTGEGGRKVNAPADRIVLNPTAYGELSHGGRHVVVTHETVHVATRTLTGPATPLWFSEGLADWAAYRHAPRPLRAPRKAAPELARAVRHKRLPHTLPSDRDFRFGNKPDALARAYEGGWLACRSVAGEWGEAKLLALYRAVGEGEAGKGERAGRGAVDHAMRDELGVSRTEFVARWRAYVRAQLS